MAFLSVFATRSHQTGTVCRQLQKTRVEKRGIRASFSRQPHPDRRNGRGGYWFSTLLSADAVLLRVTRVPGPSGLSRPGRPPTAARPLEGGRLPPGRRCTPIAPRPTHQAGRRSKALRRPRNTQAGRHSSAQPPERRAESPVARRPSPKHRALLNRSSQAPLEERRPLWRDQDLLLRSDRKRGRRRRARVGGPGPVRPEGRPYARPPTAGPVSTRTR